MHRAGCPAANKWRSQVTGRDMVPVAVARKSRRERRCVSYPLEMLPDGKPPRWWARGANLEGFKCRYYEKYSLHVGLRTFMSLASGATVKGPPSAWGRAGVREAPPWLAR